MTTQDVPARQWQQFFDQFSRLHQGKSVQIALIEPGGEPRAYAMNELFLGLVDEQHGQPGETVTVMLGGAADGAGSHSFARPMRVSLTEWNDAYSAELKITSADQRQLILQVGPAQEMLPPGTMTDGILLEKPS
jgi:hypothetical protein